MNGKDQFRLPKELDKYGRPQSIFQANAGTEPWLQIFSMVLRWLVALQILAVVILLIRCLTTGSIETRPEVPTPDPPITALIFVLVTALITSIILVIVHFSVDARLRERRILVFSVGFVWMDRDEWSLFTWDSIEAVWQHFTPTSVLESRKAARIIGGAGVAGGLLGGLLALLYLRSFGVNSTGPRQCYEVETRDGASIKMTQAFGGIETLGGIIQNAVKRSLMPKALLSLKGGKEVRFGEFGLSRVGISYYEEKLPWFQVRGIQSKDARFSVLSVRYGAKPWADVAINTIPNYGLFLELLTLLRSKKSWGDEKSERTV